ncbi:F0F1 ATP synthase subunit A, partial [Klebsiella pneumoniae]|uniref:F0F1 ATP synthase subunit A n=1 Tax=Klebsiella pneumoniae TaxID=573 RepID=UPI00385231DE
SHFGCLSPTIVATVHTDAPKLEPALSTQAATLITNFASAGAEFHPPSINEFFPDAVLFEGTVFAITRINLVQMLATAVLVILLIVGTRRMKIVPGRFQSVVEMGLDFVRVNIAEDILGRKDGRRFLPILTTIFFM